LANEFGIKHEQLDATMITKRFPQFDAVAEDEVGYFEPGAGFFIPEGMYRGAAQSGPRRLGGGKIALKTDTRVSSITQAWRYGAGRYRNWSYRERSRAVVSAGAWDWSFARRSLRQPAYGKRARFSIGSIPTTLRYTKSHAAQPSSGCGVSGDDEYFYGCAHADRLHGGQDCD